MNSAKSIVVLGILLGVGYWVYNSIHNKPNAPIPEEISDTWSESMGQVTVEMGTEGQGHEFNLPGAQPPSAAQPPLIAQPPVLGGTPPPPTAPNPPAADPSPPQLGVAGVTDVAPYAVEPGAAPPFGSQDPTRETAQQDLPPAPPAPDPQPTVSPLPGTQPDSSQVLVDDAQSVCGDFMAAIRRDLAAGKFAEVHRLLTQWYVDPRLTPQYRRRITDLLDEVAGLVVYSREHLLENPHVVAPGETLQSIAQVHNVPWQLLAKINAVPDPEKVVTGQVLKVVPGPFEAVVDLDQLQLTLKLGDLYAGRFPIGVGGDEQQLEGTYQVQAKTLNPVYYGPTGTIPGQDPTNPLGDRRLELNGRIAIHGTDNPQNVGQVGGPGTIRLSPQAIEDVYDILSVGSRVTIRR